MANSTESATFVAQHVMEINDVQKLKNEELTVTSAKFQSKDDPKPIEFEMVARFGSEKKDFLSLRFVSRKQAVTKTHSQFSVVDHEGKIMAHEEGSIRRLEPGTFMGCPEVLPLNRITGPEVTILCILEYLPSESASGPVMAHPGKTQLQTDLINLFEFGAFSDVTFLVHEKEFAAHKSVLTSRSIYFKNMFDAEMLESTTNRVHVTDVDPSTFETVLRFLYSGVVEEKQFEALAKLVAAAEKYTMDELKRICESTMRANLQMENVIDALLIADTHNCSSLLRDAKTFFKPLAKFLKKKENDWNKLVERPGLLFELLSCLAE